MMKIKRIFAITAAATMFSGILTGCGNDIQKKNAYKLEDDTVPAVKVEKISTGGDNIAAVTENGVLYVWGTNDYGQIGCTTTDYNTLDPVKIMDNVADVELGNSFSAAITKDGELYMWGRNVSGQLGIGTSDEDPHFTPVKVLDNVVKVCLGEYSTAAITENGDLYVWGGTVKEFSNGGWHGERWEKPVKVLENVSDVSVGTCAFSALTNEGILYMWGDSSWGEIPKTSTYPVEVTDIQNVKSINMGYQFNTMIDEKGNLYTWGVNSDNCLGTGKDKDLETPTKILENVIKVDVTLSSSDSIVNAAITEDNDLYVWGRYEPVPVKRLENIVDVSVEDRYSAAITENENMYVATYGSLSNFEKIEFEE